jgi:hypothetical protein
MDLTTYYQVFRAILFTNLRAAWAGRMVKSTQDVEGVLVTVTSWPERTHLEVRVADVFRDTTVEHAWSFRQRQRAFTSFFTAIEAFMAMRDRIYDSRVEAWLNQALTGRDITIGGDL